MRFSYMTLLTNDRKLLGFHPLVIKTELIKIYKIFQSVPNTVLYSSILKKIGLIGTVSSFYPMRIKNVLLWHSIYYNGFSFFVSIWFNIWKELDYIKENHSTNHNCQLIVLGFKMTKINYFIIE